MSRLLTDPSGSTALLPVPGGLAVWRDGSVERLPVAGSTYLCEVDLSHFVLVGRTGLHLDLSLRSYSEPGEIVDSTVVDASRPIARSLPTWLPSHVVAWPSPQEPVIVHLRCDVGERPELLALLDDSADRDLERGVLVDVREQMAAAAVPFDRRATLVDLDSGSRRQVRLPDQIVDLELSAIGLVTCTSTSVTLVGDRLAATPVSGGPTAVSINASGELIAVGRRVEGIALLPVADDAPSEPTRIVPTGLQGGCDALAFLGSDRVLVARHRPGQLPHFVAVDA